MKDQSEEIHWLHERYITQKIWKVLQQDWSVFILLAKRQDVEWNLNSRHVVLRWFSYRRNTSTQDGPQDSTQDNTQDSLQNRILEYCKVPRSKKEITVYMGYKDVKSFAKICNSWKKGRKIMCGRYYVDDDTAREIEKVVREVDEKLRRERRVIFIPLSLQLWLPEGNHIFWQKKCHGLSAISEKRAAD